MGWLILAVVLLLVVLLLPGVSMTRFVEGFIKGKPLQVELASIGGGLELQVDAARNFIAMRSAAELAGVELKVNTAFRDNAFQARLYAAFQAGTGNLAAPPGWSTHQAGLSVDISTGGMGRASAAYQWLHANAATFGFVNDVTSEPWHWTFKGVTT